MSNLISSDEGAALIKIWLLRDVYKNIDDNLAKH